MAVTEASSAGGGLRLAQVLMTVFEGVADPGTAVYVSAPITTGRRFVEWRRGPGAGLEAGSKTYEEQHDRYVKQINIEMAKPVVRRARRRLGGVVIDPTALTVQDWGQREYHQLWCAVVERFAGTVVFVDGWEYSTGCVWEFVAALENGAALLDERLAGLSPREGLRRVVAALEDLGDGVLSTDGLERARARLQAADGPPLEMTSG